jgi:hypothetical protein
VKTKKKKKLGLSLSQSFKASDVHF